MITTMRTTLDIEDSVLSAAKEIAGARKTTAGAVISELARKGLTLSTQDATASQSGFPTFSIPANPSPLTSATVKSILTDEGLSPRR